ncbi:MAG: single-stranded-DNA-specific exonuclease RecJ [Anaerolineaceae bacterium]|nr:single-stranded-DNA-specific exonuclease RecJ [Anaerolineaceae bacterium]
MQPSTLKHWIVRPSIPPETREALPEYPAHLQQLLFNRRIVDPVSARDFLEARCPDGCDPFSLTGMQSAVDRIGEAIRSGEAVAIYGDYDVDGVTATVLLVQALRALGGTASEYIPDRVEEGYGLNLDAMDLLKSQGVRLVITVDNGIRSLTEAAHARHIGLDLIITDHHQPQSGIPDAFAVIDAKQAGDCYPNKNLSGVGVAYKLVQALVQSFPQAGVISEDFLDLVALGTVADLVPLIGENRYFVTQGLQRIRNTRRQGVYSLANVSGLDIRKTNTSDIGFVLGPRLNAAGRVESAKTAFRLLMSTDAMEAGQLAQALEVHNQERKHQTQAIEVQVEAMIAAMQAENYLIFASDTNFKSGVVGLAASHIAEVYYRPAIVAERGEQTTRGSARSIPGFHITRALDECADLLVRHGGHEQAAGFTVDNELLDDLVRRLQGIALRELSSADLRPVITIDLDIPLKEATPALMETLDRLQPFGESNPEPFLVSRNLQVMYPKLVGKEGKHLKFKVTDGWITFDAIAFRMGSRLGDLTGRVDLVYTFERNDYNGRMSFQLNVKDIKRSGLPD